MTLIIIAIFSLLMGVLVGPYIWVPERILKHFKEPSKGIDDPLFDPKGEMDKIRREKESLKKDLSRLAESNDYLTERSELLEDIMKALDQETGQEELMWLLKQTKRKLPASPLMFSSGICSGFSTPSDNLSHFSLQ